jgi:hypothetical protein
MIAALFTSVYNPALKGQKAFFKISDATFLEADAFVLHASKIALASGIIKILKFPLA